MVLQSKPSCHSNAERMVQGWRLDPLLLLCQLLTTTVAISYAWETFTARQDADRQQQVGHALCASAGLGTVARKCRCHEPLKCWTDHVRVDLTAAGLTASWFRKGPRIGIPGETRSNSSLDIPSDRLGKCDLLIDESLEPCSVSNTSPCIEPHNVRKACSQHVVASNAGMT